VSYLALDSSFLWRHHLLSQPIGAPRSPDQLQHRTEPEGSDDRLEKSGRRDFHDRRLVASERQSSKNIPRFKAAHLRTGEITSMHTKNYPMESLSRNSRKLNRNQPAVSGILRLLPDLANSSGVPPRRTGRAERQSRPTRKPAAQSGT